MKAVYNPDRSPTTIGLGTAFAGIVKFGFYSKQLVCKQLRQLVQGSGFVVRNYWLATDSDQMKAILLNCYEDGHGSLLR